MTTLAYLSVEVKGQNYGLTILSADETTNGCKVARLEKNDGTCYEVEEGTDRTTCTCPDFVRRHACLPTSLGCKHVQALVGLGMIVNVQPWDVREEDMEPEMGVTGAWFAPNTIEVIEPTVPPAPLAGHAAQAPRSETRPIIEVGTVESLGLVAQVAVNEVWFQATRTMDAPRISDLDGAIVDGIVSIPRCLDAVAKLIAANRVMGGLPHTIAELAEEGENAKETEASENAPSIASKPPATTGRRGRPTLAYEVNWSELGRRYSEGEGYRLLASEAGIGASTFYNRMRGLGYKVERANERKAVMA